MQPDPRVETPSAAGFATSPLLSELPAANRRLVMECAERVAVRRGEVVIREGETAGFFYILDRGRALIRRRLGAIAESTKVARLEPGDSFGEEQLVRAAPQCSVVMLSDGELLRLRRADFLTLVRDPLIDPVPYRTASALIGEGATWLDVRSRERYLTGSFEGAASLPLDRVRGASRKLPSDRRYVVCADDADTSSIGALLLVARGFDAVCLREGMREVLPGAREARRGPGEAGVDEEAEAPIPRDLYDETFIGKSLADLIEQLHARRRDLEEVEAGGDADAEEELVELDLEPGEAERGEGKAQATAREGAGDADADELRSLMAEVEARLRALLEAAVQSERKSFRAELEERVERVKHAAAEELKRRAARVEGRYREAYARKEEEFRARYEKLMKLAHRISRQKAEIQRARKALGEKLGAAERLQRELDGLREVLAERIGTFDGLENDDEG